MSEIANNTSEFLLSTGTAQHKLQANPGAEPAVADSQASAASPQRLLNLWAPYLLAAGLLGCYFLFFMSLYLADLLDATPGSVAGVFTCWVGGFVWLVSSSRTMSTFSRLESRTDLILALWCNLGMVAIATLLGGDMRLLLLVGVVFGLLYTGLQFSEGRVRSVMLGTMVAYVFSVAVKSIFAPLVLEYELICALGFAVMLFAASLIAREIIRLRMQARSRNKKLAEALRRVEELALRDELTGLYNRRHLLDFLERAIATRERGGPSFALAYCDLDHFKRVNDRFGHECGDRLLQSFAQAASNSVRSNDLVARMGGEEFVLVLVDTDEEGASDIVERLRMRTAALRVSSAEPTYKVTVSSGLASYREGDTVEGMLRRADTALYEAKDQGRDRLVRA